MAYVMCNCMEIITAAV